MILDTIVRWKFSKISTYVVVNSRGCAALTLSCASVKINQNWNVIVERRACEFARVREPSLAPFLAAASNGRRRRRRRVSREPSSFDFAFLPRLGQIFRNNVTYTTVARWIKEGSWLPAIRAFNLAHEPFGSRLPPRTCPGYILKQK